MACSYNSSIVMSASFKPPLLFILLACVYRLRGRGGGEGGRGGERLGASDCSSSPVREAIRPSHSRDGVENEVCH